MKTLKKTLLLLIAFAFTLTVYAQKITLNKANALFENLAYSEAAPMYLRVLEIDSMNSVALHNISECYRKLNEYKNTEKYFSKVMNLPDVKPIEKYYYGLALMENDKYNEAKKWIGAYQALVPTDERGANGITSIENFNYFLQDSSNYTISNFNPINGDHSDFGPIYYNDGILFSSNRYFLDEISNIHRWTGKDFYNVYYYDSLNNLKPVKFSGSVQTRFNNGPVSFDKKNELLYVTRNKVQEGKVIKASDDQIKLQIYAYKYNEISKEWSDEIIFDNNILEYNVAHPAVSYDGSIIVYSSDIPGGFGGMDLYVCKKDGEKWGSPVNLGPSINTMGNEIFPYLTANNILVFSSNGLEGMGGLDLYYTTLNNGKVDEIKNFGYPVNTQLDDFSMVLNDNFTNAFFTSNREGGHGDDDIYKLIIRKTLKTENPEFNLSFTGIVKNRKTLEVLDKVNVTITHFNDTTYEGYSDFNGFFDVPIKVQHNDTVLISILLKKDGFLCEELKYIYIARDSNAVDLNKDLQVLMTPVEKLPFINPFEQILVSFSGVVKNIKTLKPIDKVYVIFVDKNSVTHTTYTDSSGYFKIPIKIKQGDSISITVFLEKEEFLEYKSTNKLLADTARQIDLNKKLELLMIPVEPIVTNNTNQYLLSFAGIVKNRKTLDLLDSVNVIITDAKAITHIGKTNASGLFDIPLMVRNNDTISITIMLEKKGFLREELKLSYIVINASKVDLNKIVQLLMTPVESLTTADLMGQDLMKKFIINPIYFNFDKYNIRPDAAKELDKIVAIMNEYPGMCLDVRSHTDCRGPYVYNMTLSNNRCISTIAYIVANGISKDRLTGKGYGEIQLVTNCPCEGKQFSSCTNAMHDLNRRSEFIVVKM